jgi:hypothetical protein
MKPLNWLLVLFAIVGALLSSCTSSTPVVSPTRAAMATLTPSPEFSCPPMLPTSVSGVSQVLLIDEAPQHCFPTDGAKITAVALERNILKINVTYQGHCQEHTFGLHGETAFLLSNPPQWSLYLSHNAHGDTCSENVEKLLSFDLTPMDKARTERHGHPLLLRVIEPAGGSFADESFIPLIEWP